MSLHRRARAAASPTFKGYEAALLFGSGYLANTGAVAALAGRGEVVFSDELNHASIIDGCRLAARRDLRLPPRRHRAPRVGPARGRRPRRADRHRRRLLDGRRRRAAGRAGRAGAPPRLPADGRRGARAPGRSARAGAARSPRPASAARSTWSSARSARRSAATAPTSAPRAELIELLRQHRAPVHLLDRAAAARRSARRSRRWSCSSGARTWSSSCAATPRRCARRSPPRGLAVGALADPDRPGDRRRRHAGDGALRAGARAAASSPRRSARRPCPRAPRGCGCTVMATHRADELRARSAGDRPPGGRELGLATPAAAAAPRAAAPRRVSDGCLRHRHRHRGRQDGRRGGDRPHRGGGRAPRRGLQARRQRPRRGAARPTTSCCAAPRARAQSDDEIAPYRYGPPVSPHLGAELAGEEIDPGRLRAAAARAAAGADVLVAEGVGGLLVPLTLRLPGPRPRASTSGCRS